MTLSALTPVHEHTMVRLPSGPLGQIEILSVALFIKGFLLLLVLLILTYVSLRWYARQQRAAHGGGPNMHALSSLSLTPRTRVFLVRAGTQELLITESSVTINVLLIRTHDVESAP